MRGLFDLHAIGSRARLIRYRGANQVLIFVAAQLNIAHRIMTYSKPVRIFILVARTTLADLNR